MPPVFKSGDNGAAGAVHNEAPAVDQSSLYDNPGATEPEPAKQPEKASGGGYDGGEQKQPNSSGERGRYPNGAADSLAKLPAGQILKLFIVISRHYEIWMI